MTHHPSRRRPRRPAPSAAPLPLRVALTLLLLLPLMPAALGSAPPRPSAAYDCEGGACAAVALVWEEEGQRFRVDNSSTLRVRVEVETFAGKSSVVVEGQASDYLRVKTFNGPYRAEYE